MKGQTSIELVLVAILILVSAIYLMNFYAKQSKVTTYVAIARQDVDTYLGMLRFNGCNAQLVNISNYTTSDGTNAIEIYLKPGCACRQASSLSSQIETDMGDVVGSSCGVSIHCI